MYGRPAAADSPFLKVDAGSVETGSMRSPILSLPPILSRSRPSPGFDLCVVLGLSACLLVWVCVSDTVRILVAWAVAPMLPVRSAPALAGLVVASGVALTLLAVSRRRGLKVSDRLRNSLAAVLIGALACGHLAVLVAHLHTASDAGVPATWAGLHWLGDRGTESALWQTHAGRAALGALGDRLGWMPDPLDLAQPMAAHLPPWFGFLIAACVTASGVAALGLLPGVARRFETVPGVVWLYGCAALNGVAGILEGGPLEIRSLPALAIVALVLAARDGAHLWQLAGRFGPWLAGAVLLQALSMQSSGIGGDASAPASLAGFAIVIVLPLLVGWQPRRSARKRIRAALLATYLACAGAFYSISAVSGVGVLIQPLSAGGRFAAIDLDRLAIEAVGAIPAGATPADVYREFGEDPMAPRRVFVWREVSEPRGPVAVEVAFVGAVPSFDRVPATTVTRLVQAESGAGAQRRTFAFRTDDAVTAPFRGEDRSLLARHNDRVHLMLASAWLRAAGAREWLIRAVPETASESSRDAATTREPLRLVQQGSH